MVGTTGVVPMIGRLWRRLFYSPSRHAKSLKFISIGNDTVFIPGAGFDFRVGSDKFKGAVSIGSRSMIGCQFIFESDSGSISIGNDSFLNSGTRLISRCAISVGSNVTVAWGCVFYDHNSHSLDWRERQNDLDRQMRAFNVGRDVIEGKNWGSVKSRPIVIHNKVWIGFGVIILGGVTIGEGAVVSAGSVVRTDVEAWTVVAGNPAVTVKRLRIT